ncbi:hypothetical protein GCM10017608_24990 [Agromyces luteolus]|nr:hypothetical protein GCM10017608_24990 [Agromyces luteolus]
MADFNNLTKCMRLRKVRQTVADPRPPTGDRGGGTEDTGRTSLASGGDRRIVAHVTASRRCTEVSGSAPVGAGAGRRGSGEQPPRRPSLTDPPLTRAGPSRRLES